MVWPCHNWGYDVNLIITPAFLPLESAYGTNWYQPFEDNILEDLPSRPAGLAPMGQENLQGGPGHGVVVEVVGKSPITSSLVGQPPLSSLQHEVVRLV